MATFAAEGSGSVLGLGPAVPREAILAGRLMATVLDNPFIPEEPHPRQAQFLLTGQREILFGGAAGGGKSSALLMAALQHVAVPGYAALVLRRTYRDLSLPGALIDRSHEWLTGTAAKWDGRNKTWTFPGGATLAFGYLDAENDKYRYQSSEFQLIALDELTQFRRSQYLYLFSRLRRRVGMEAPLRIVGASNPGGVGHDWVRQRFLLSASPDRAFLPAALADNPSLDRAAYQDTLAELDPLTRRRLLEGDWHVGEDGLVAWDWLVACESADGPPPVAGVPELYVGVDVGRTRDLTVVWTWQRLGDVLWCRDLCVLHGVPFARQRDEIAVRLSPGVVKCLVDKGGIGYQLAEELESSHRGVVEGVHLTAGAGGRMAQRLATALAERRVRLPVDEKLRADFRLVRRLEVVHGSTRVATDRNDESHADRFWAAALATEAAARFERPQAVARPLVRP